MVLPDPPRGRDYARINSKAQQWGRTPKFESEAKGRKIDQRLAASA